MFQVITYRFYCLGLSYVLLNIDIITYYRIFTCRFWLYCLIKLQAKRRLHCTDSSQTKILMAAFCVGCQRHIVYPNSVRWLWKRNVRTDRQTRPPSRCDFFLCRSWKDLLNRYMSLSLRTVMMNYECYYVMSV